MNPLQVRPLIAAVAVSLSVITGAALRAEPIAPKGCPQAHCDAGNSDLAAFPPPTGEVAVVWLREDLAGEQTGSRAGLGCSSDGTMAVCTYAGPADSVVAYDYDGNHLWSSGALLSGFAHLSAPLILDNGDVIVTDHARVVRIDSGGEVVWNTVLPFGGLAISPVLTDDDVIVLATAKGPVYAIDNETGAVLGFLFVKFAPGVPGFYTTINTPALDGNRVYISAEHRVAGKLDTTRPGRLLAIDIDRGEPAPLTLAWHFDFEAPSHSSPLRVGDVVYFDGGSTVAGGVTAPFIFAVRDAGTGAQEQWRVRLATRAVASFAEDPRPGAGFWHLQSNRSWIFRRSYTDGAIVQQIQVGALLGEPAVHTPFSAITVADGDEGPVLMMGLFAAGSAFVAAFDVVNETLLWKVKTSESPTGLPVGQFPIIAQGADTRVVFSAWGGGARAVGVVVP